MNETLRENINTLYGLCDKAGALPVSPKSSYGTYRQALKTEFEGFIGYLMLNTDINEKESVEFVQEYFDYRITASALKKLPSDYPLKSNLKKYTLELLDYFIILDNKMKANDSNYENAIAQLVFLLLFQVTCELFRSLTEISDKLISFADDFLKNMQRHVVQSVNVQVEAEKRTLREIFHKAKNSAEDEENDDELIEQQPEVTETLEQLLGELQALTGLTEVKKDVSSMINMLKIQQVRQQRGLKSTPMSLHMVFYGNPGTGKTTVARLLAKIYYRMGVLSKGHLIETDRAGLVSGYVGHTALKVKKVVKQALGGILFIDEAYTLTRSQSGNDFGQEAVDTLLKCMEDRRSDLIVIVAGYPELMSQFISSNPGLQSRFNKYINFVDYKPDELLAIFETMCRQQGYHLSDKAKMYARNYFIRLYENKDENFANGRDVRNYFEKAISRQANRLALNSNWTNDQLARLEVSDLDDNLSESYEADTVLKQQQKKKSDVPSVPQSGKELHSGERADMTAYAGKRLELRLTYDGLNSGIELDGYAFMLGENGRVFSDDDLIFFGHEESADGSVSVDTQSAYPSIVVQANRITGRYAKVSVCFSAYGDNDLLNFTKVQNPVIQVICEGKELYHLPLKHLSREKCLVGIEIYQNKGTWKLKAVGAGYNGKLRTLCESFGVEIE